MTAAREFAARYEVMHRWRTLSNGDQVLLVGADRFAFPIPLKKKDGGQWFFDAAAGRDEILSRRLGRNELPDAHKPFNGYYFRMLSGLTKNAPGGPKEYVVNGEMAGGFAIVAYPAEYGNSGVMTLIISQDGVLLQKDLGKRQRGVTHPKS
jgi:hypothetical protein